MRLPGILDGYRQAGAGLPIYAWPGGYAIAYVCDDGELLCGYCVNDDTNPVHSSSEDSTADGWRIDGYVTADSHDLGEGAWTCAHCYRVIDPAVEEDGMNYDEDNEN